MSAALREKRDGKLFQKTVRGRYIDQWSRQDGRWAIDQRTYVHDFDSVSEVTETSLDGWGRRDRGDRAYGPSGL